jgi:hypothetical protein
MGKTDTGDSTPNADVFFPALHHQHPSRKTQNFE